MANFLQSMQPGKGPTDQLMLELAALGGLINAVQDLINRLNNVEVRVLSADLYTALESL